MRGGWLLLWLGCAASAAPALWPGDPAVAEVMWQSGRAAKGDAWQSRVYVDVAWAQEQVAPWQPGWSSARAHLRAIAAGRRAALADDRGGRRGDAVDEGRDRGDRGDVP